VSIVSQNIDNQQVVVLDLSKFPAGVYFLLAFTKQGVHKGSLLVTH
jgi:hypothetical protein